MALPNPSMSFSPFAILTAEELNDFVENDQALAAGTGLNNSSIATAKIADSAITNVKLNTALGELGGAWKTFVPIITCPGGTAPTYSTSNGKYMQIGKTVFVTYNFQNSSGGTAGSGAAQLLFSLPVSANTTNLGGGTNITWNGTGLNFILPFITSSSSFSIRNLNTGILSGVDQNAASRFLFGYLIYEAA